MNCLTGQSKISIHHLRDPQNLLDKTVPRENYELYSSTRKGRSRFGALDAILAYLDLGYYLCFVPFHFKWSPENGTYEIRESKFQKVLAIFFHLLNSVIFVYSGAPLLTGYQAEGSYMKPVKIAQTIATITFIFLFWKAMFNTNDFRIFFELVQKREYQGQHGNEGGAKMKKWGCALGVFSIFIGLQTYLVRCVYMEAVPEGINSPAITNLEETNSWLFNIKFGLPYILKWMYCYGRAVSESASLLLCGLGFYLKAVSGDLVGTLMDGKINHAGIMARYLRLKKINDGANSIGSSLMFMFVIGSVPYVSEIMAINNSETSNWFAVATAGAFYLITMIGSAEGNRKANELRFAFLQYSHRRGTKLGREEFQNEEDEENVSALMLLSELTTPDVGLTGSHFFTVTYSFVGVMMSQCIVYALIIVQLQQGQRR